MERGEARCQARGLVVLRFRRREQGTCEATVLLDDYEPLFVIVVFQIMILHIFFSSLGLVPDLFVGKKDTRR